MLTERIQSYTESMRDMHVHATEAYQWVDDRARGIFPLLRLPGIEPIAPDSRRARTPTIGELTVDVIGE